MRVLIDHNRCPGLCAMPLPGAGRVQASRQGSAAARLAPDEAHRLHALHAAAACPVHAVAIDHK